MKKKELVLLGFSSPSCASCVKLETPYKEVSPLLKQMNVPFVRVDADKFKNIAKVYKIVSIPSIVAVYKGRAVHYEGVHSSEGIQAFAKKIRAPPVKKITSIEDVTSFMENYYLETRREQATNFIGFFNEEDDGEEMEEYLEVAAELYTKDYVNFAVVTSKPVIEHYQKAKWFKFAPSIVADMASYNYQRAKDSLYLPTFFNQGSLEQWFNQRTIKLVDEIKPSNFAMYESLALPMVMLFLNLEDLGGGIDQDPKKVGLTNGVRNRDLIADFERAASKFRGKVVFVYSNGIKHADQMKALGLVNGVEALPTLAMNTMTDFRHVFPLGKTLNEDGMTEFINDFLAGRVYNHDGPKPSDYEEQRRKKFLERRERLLNKEPDIPGVKESFDKHGDDHVKIITMDNFESEVLSEGKDMILLFHSDDCENCGAMAVYYKRVALRFHELGIKSVVVARYDLTWQPTPRATFNVQSLPSMVMLPAYEKFPPYKYYSGVSRVQSIMEWVHENAAIKFDLPELPQFNEEDKRLYKEQIREREEVRKRDGAKDEL